MGRKKKRRSSERKAAELAARAAEQAAEAADEPKPLPTAATDAPPAADAAPAPPPTPPTEATPPTPAVMDEEPVEVLDVDPDEAGPSDSYASLVAEVAGLPDESRAGAGAARKPVDADVVSVEDIDEVIDLDDDDGAPAAVSRLIAQAGVGTPVEEPDAEEEIAVIDLDADAVAPGAPAIAGRPRGQAAPTAERLVQAAAAGAIDSADEAEVSLDLGEVSTPEARARLLAEALAHAEHKEARYRVPLVDKLRAERWKAVAASVLLLLAGTVAVAPPEWVRPDPPARLNAAARERDVRMALLLQAHQIEAFRVRWQRLPVTLDELAGALQGIRYARSGTRSYQLITFQPDGTTILYDSANPAPAFRMLMHVWPPSGGAQ